MVFLVFPSGDMFFIMIVSCLMVGDEIFALLICDEDLEYGARHPFGFAGGGSVHVWGVI